MLNATEQDAFLETFWLYVMGFLSNRSITQELSDSSLIERVIIGPPNTLTFFARALGSSNSIVDLPKFELRDPETNQTFNYLQRTVDLMGPGAKDAATSYGMEKFFKDFKYPTALSLSNLPNTFFSPRPGCDGRKLTSDFSLYLFVRHCFSESTLVHDKYSGDMMHSHVHTMTGGMLAPEDVRCFLSRFLDVNRHISQFTPEAIGPAAQKFKNLISSIDVDNLCKNYRRDVYIPLSKQTSTLAIVTKETFFTTLYWQFAMEAAQSIAHLYLPDTIKKYAHWLRLLSLFVMLPSLILSQPEILISFLLSVVVQMLMRAVGFSKTLLICLGVVLCIFIFIREGIDDEAFTKLARHLGSGTAIVTVKSAKTLASLIWRWANSGINLQT